MYDEKPKPKEKSNSHDHLWAIQGSRWYDYRPILFLAVAFALIFLPFIQMPIYPVKLFLKSGITIIFVLIFQIAGTVGAFRRGTGHIIVAVLANFFLLCPLGVGSTLMFLFASETHLQTITTDRAIYHLEQRAWSDWDLEEGVYYSIYRCDRSEVLCHEIFSQGYSNWSNAFTMNNDYCRDDVYLNFDPPTNTLSLIMCGQTEYSEILP